MKSSDSQVEAWTLRYLGVEETYSVDVTHGKRIDILSLKAPVITELQERLSEVAQSRTALYAGSGLQEMDECPICGSRSIDDSSCIDVYGARYCQCGRCQHHFVKRQPSWGDIIEFYTRCESYQADYADEETSEMRVKQVAVPKLLWTIAQFEKTYGRKPESILDVGAGSGHFVRACHDMGIKSCGIEPSESGRRFCDRVFGLELENRDFTTEWREFRGFDVITFWGVIEHVPHPMRMLRAASEALKGKEGMVVVEVPRFDSLSTILQSAFPQAVLRHLDPLGHLNCFSDNSLSTALRLSGFSVTSAWYFGMDAYELLMQVSMHLGDSTMLHNAQKVISRIQAMVDIWELSDEIVLAGIPLS